MKEIIDFNTFRSVPKFLDRQVWANSVDPDQTQRKNKEEKAQARGAVWSESTLLAQVQCFSIK